MKTAVMEQFGEPLKVHADWGFSGTSRYPHLVGDGAGGSGVLEYRPTGWPTESTEKLFWRRQSAPNQALHLTAAAHAGSGPLGKFNEQCGQSGLERTTFGHG